MKQIETQCPKCDGVTTYFRNNIRFYFGLSVVCISWFIAGLSVGYVFF